jgi:hypothetical protein
MTEYEYYWELVRLRVCSHCVDGDGTGGCRIDSGRDCALKKYLPQIIEVVDSVKSQSILPYENLLRSRICGMCIHQSPDGVCSVRDEVECALDRYFPLIVQVIEEARENPLG